MLWESGGGGDGASFTIINGDTLRFTAKDGGASLIANASLADLGGEFIQAVATYDRDNPGDTDTLRLYINGRLVGGPVTDTNVEDWSGADDASIGVRGNGDTGGHNASGSLNFNTPFDGQISIFRFYDSTLTADATLNNFLAVAGTDVYFDDGDTGDSDWSSGANWNTNAVPFPVQDVIINGGLPPADLTTDETVNSVQVGSADTGGPNTPGAGRVGY